MPRPLKDFPSEINGAVREPCSPAPCFKCSARTTVGFRAKGRAWPTCYDCAIRAAKECPVCGRPVDLHTFDEIPQPNGERALIRTALEHADRSHCHPLELRERYALPCSSCSATLRFQLVVGMARIGGLPTELACACGARWALGNVRRGYQAYLAPVA